MLFYRYMTPSHSALHQTDIGTSALEKTLEELDQMVHRSKALLQRVHTSSVEERLKAWESVKGILKGKIDEDPVVYQRRIRDEEDL